jgi:hypothetical protein
VSALAGKLLKGRDLPLLGVFCAVLCFECVVRYWMPVTFPK